MEDTELKAAGWSRLAATHFNRTAGPFWIRRDGAGLELALQTCERHSNGNIGTVHGGVLMTFADVALGCRVAEALGEPLCATLQLSFGFTATARLGSFLTCRPELVRQTSQIVFTRGLVVAGERVIGTAEGVWKALDREKFASLKG